MPDLANQSFGIQLAGTLLLLLSSKPAYASSANPFLRCDMDRNCIVG